MFNKSIPGRRASQKKPAGGQEGDRRPARDKNSQLRPASIATNRSISPYRSLEFWQTATEFDLIDLGSPDESSTSSAVRSHQSEDSSKRYSSQFLGTDSGEPTRTRRSVKSEEFEEALQL